MTQRKTSQYRGVLGLPLRLINSPPELFAEELCKPLWAEFGIEANDPHRWQRLPLALAFRHVPAFKFSESFMEELRTAKKGGKTGFDRFALVSAVCRAIRVEARRSPEEPPRYFTAPVCKRLTSRGQPFAHLRPKQLQVAYYRYRNDVLERWASLEQMAVSSLPQALALSRIHKALRALRQWANPKAHGLQNGKPEQD